MAEWTHNCRGRERCPYLGLIDNVQTSFSRHSGQVSCVNELFDIAYNFLFGDSNFQS